MLYEGTIFGKWKIPCHLYVEGEFSLEDVEIAYRDTEKKLPEEIENYKSELVAAKKKEAESIGAPFFDGKRVGLLDYAIVIDDPCTEAQKLKLKLGPTTWFTYAATNQSLDKKLDGKTIRQKYVGDPLDLNDVLSNAIGVSTTVINEEGKIFMVERGKLGQYTGIYGVAAAGFMDREKDVMNGKPNPFKTIQREIGEELGLNCSPDDFEILGVGRATDDLHGEIICEYRTDMSANEIHSIPKRDKYEALRLFDIPFEPEPVLKYINKTIKEIPIGVPNDSNVWIIGESPKWVPAHAVNTVKSLVNEYGYEKVWETAKDL